MVRANSTSLFQHVGVGGSDQLPGPSKTHVKIKWDLTEPRNQLGVDDEVLLNMRISKGAYRGKYTHEVGFPVGKGDMTVAIR